MKVWRAQFYVHSVGRFYFKESSIDGHFYLIHSVGRSYFKESSIDGHFHLIHFCWTLTQGESSLMDTLPHSLCWTFLLKESSVDGHFHLIHSVGCSTSRRAVLMDTFTSFTLLDVSTSRRAV
ncbi:hypothetical protein AVEN_120360-1 [Araneus ventricosus]|uniref:Uncharacterized protein n=1 Tax=Araneus ventricosus TaxID=182803 RepID=A0A4Y2UP15_ARAVE|nr:hypothetical protein AVEN_120360-1 [Araneus ventricosus]